MAVATVAVRAAATAVVAAEREAVAEERAVGAVAAREGRTASSFLAGVLPLAVLCTVCTTEKPQGCALGARGRR